MMQLNLKFSNRGTTLIVSMSGELDHHYAENARIKLDNELMKSTTRDVIFDLNKLGFMDSSGIGVLAGRYKNIQRLGGSMAIVCVNAQIKRILEMSGLLKIIPACASLEQAMDELAAGARTKSKGREDKDAAVK